MCFSHCRRVRLAESGEEGEGAQRHGRQPKTAKTGLRLERSTHELGR
jgi:hypothetical protein